MRERGGGLIGREGPPGGYGGLLSLIHALTLLRLRLRVLLHGRRRVIYELYRRPRLVSRGGSAEMSPSLQDRCSIIYSLYGQSSSTEFEL